MAQASSSRVSLRYVKESVYGVTPVNPVMKTIRRVPGGGGLVRNSQVVSSQEADASRTIPDQVETGYSAAFDYNWELSSGSHDDFFVAILGGQRYTATTGALTTISAVATGNKIARTAGSFITDGFKPGMWVKISGFTGVIANNGLARILDATSDVTALELNIDPITKTLVNDAAGEPVTVSGDMVRTGTANQDSFSMEAEFTDISAALLQGVGYRPTNFAMDGTAGNIVTGSFNFLGLTTIPSTVPFVGETIMPAGTTQSMNATSNVGTLYEGANPITTLARQITINVNPNVTELRAVSHAAAAGLIDGIFDIQVGVNLYFSDMSYVNKVISRTPTSLWLPFSDAAGNHIVFSFPRGYLSGTPREQAQNTPVAQDLTYTPVRYTGYNLTPSIMMQMDFLK